MPRKHSPEVDSAVARALLAGTPKADIKRQLRAGALPGVGPTDIAERTFYNLAARVERRLLDKSGYGDGGGTGSGSLLRDIAAQHEPEPVKPPAHKPSPGDPADKPEPDPETVEWEARLAQTIEDLKERERQYNAERERAEAPARAVLAEQERRKREKATPREPGPIRYVKLQDPQRPWRVWREPVGP